ncbi:AEC family transporter [Enterococcus saccharolyticus]|uniref:AEC family transporter n=1 Tax=Enterococcus TaxID=1350 RepID=UPI001E601D2A|nr:AEC family transporter [Enterococcus saccharolyticus]MCD5002677.1 AEC family transporter [Enterococcus saccharolyticus]
MLEAYLNILVIFLLMFLGYWLSFKQWFSNRTADVFSKLVLNVSLPFSMFLNITSNFSREEFVSLFSGMIIPFISMILTLLFSFVYRKIAHIPTNRQGTFSTMITCSNTIFIGLPINLAIFGEQSIPYVLLYYIINTTIFWTIGIYLIATDNSQVEQVRISFHPLVALKKIFSPTLLGFIIGLIWMLCSLSVPTLIQSFGTYLADLTTPLSMFAIGIMVYFNGIKNLKMTKDILGVLVGRYFVAPFIVWFIGQWIAVPTLMLQVFIIQSAMPVQNSVPILARTYHADEEFAASSMGYSVLIYMFYIPFLLHAISFI